MNATLHPLDAAATAVSWLDRPFAVTTFKNYAAATKREEPWTLRTLAERIRATTASKKEALPWLKLARFGDIRSDKNSLRHDGNVQAITGLEGDYDGEKITVAEAVEKLEKAGILAMVYTSPSHAEDAPRWRVICPTSTELPPENREKLMGRLNGLFGGVFSGESWTLSQSYYYGSVSYNPAHRMELIDGTPIDLHDDLDEIWKGKPNTSTTTKANGERVAGPLDEAALLAEIAAGASYHEPTVRLLGRWALQGVPLMQARQRLLDAFDAVFPPDRDARWHARRADVHRCLEHIYGKEAQQQDDGKRPTEPPPHPGYEGPEATADGRPKGDGARLVLSPSAPLNSAREMVRRAYLHPECRTLHHQQAAFYCWRGTHYAEAAHETIRADIYAFLDGATRIVDDKPAPFNPDKGKVANVLEALAAVAQLPDTAVAPSWLDDAPHPSASEFLPCANGLLHLPTRALSPATPAFFGLNAVDYAYEAAAPKPAEWLKFLTSIWPDDQASINTLQELFGLLLTGDTSQEKAFMIVGPKRSGKGTLARVLTAMLGRENVAGPTLSSLTQNFGLAPLIGKPLAIISDARLGGRSDASVVVERLLAITGEDAISVDRKFREAWTGRLPTRFLMLTNELPRIADASGALASRFIVFLLRKSFYGHEDTALTGKLIAELPGILQWSIDGRDRLVKRGHFVQPASAKQAADELADLGSPIGAFLRDRCLVGPEYAAEVDQLYGAWTAWCRDNARDYPGTVQMFGRDLRAAVPGLDTTQPRDGKTGERVRYYQGVGLAPPPTAGAHPPLSEPPADRWPD
jgi:putative DNA primase/helicase